MPRIFKPIRWTVERAASEFNLDRKTLGKRINARSIVPGDDGMFSTAEICAAIFSDGDAARTALAVAQTENFDLKNKKLAGQLADCALFQQLSDGVILILRQKISDAPISDELKDSLLKEIESINVDEVVKANPKSDDSDLEEQP